MIIEAIFLPYQQHHLDSRIYVSYLVVCIFIGKMSRVVFLLLAFCTVAFALGQDLKTILSSVGERCGKSQVTCPTSIGSACCDLPLVSNRVG